jgi:deoxyadenosine/deoxycytidine kinase
MAQIFITGHSGIGKTTLANYISCRYRIPFINGSSKTLWDKYNIKKHEDILLLCSQDPEKALKFQYELLEKRYSDTYNLPDFVSDRSIIDNCVYTIIQLAPYLSEDSIELYLLKAKELIDCYSNHPKLIYLSGDLVDKDKFHYEQDGMRLDNYFYQVNVVNPIFEKFLKDNTLKLNLTDNNFKVINFYDWETRIEIIESFLQTKPNILIRWLKNQNHCL